MSDVLFQFFVDYILPVMGTAAGSLASYAMYQGIGWLKGKSHDARFHCAMDKIGSLTEAAVLEASQTTVKSLRKADKWGPAAAAGVRADVMAVVRRHLGRQGWEEVKGCLGQTDEVIEGMIRTQIEAQLAKLKRK